MLTEKNPNPGLVATHSLYVQVFSKHLQKKKAENVSLKHRSALERERLSLTALPDMS